jgi:hypothetical protein
MRRKDRRAGPGGSISNSIPFRRDFRSNEGTFNLASFTVGVPGADAIIMAMTPAMIGSRRVPKPVRKLECWTGILMDRTIVSVSREPGAKEISGGNRF